jgi:hypothetical protein
MKERFTDAECWWRMCYGYRPRGKFNLAHPLRWLVDEVTAGRLHNYEGTP